jgi:RecB family exonuclease
VTSLPEPLVQCRVPAAFSPSQLAFGEQCLLRAVLGSARDLAALTAHPAAAIGRVFHKLLEMAVRGEIPRTGTPAEDAERTLDRLLDAEDARFAATWPSDPPRLREVFAPLAWRRKRRVVLDLAQKYLSGAVPRVVGSTGGRARNPRDLPLNGSWAEVQIEAPTMRLRGRADMIQRTAGDVVIRDLKTGRLLTNDGDVLPHIERQMRLYGAMAHAVWPSAKVSLVVDHGDEREVEFTREQEREVLTWLSDVLGRLPADHDVDAETLATPGEACEGCTHRHICPAYRKRASDFWLAEVPVRMPLDTWGEVVAIVTRGSLADLTMRDAAGRTVKVFGLAIFRVSAMQPGDTAWLFGLRTRDKRGGKELWRHPRNFFEVADDDPFARAWTLEVFTNQPGRGESVDRGTAQSKSR